MPNLTYTQGRNLYGTLTNNLTTTNLAFGDTLIGQYTLELIHKYPFIFGEKTFTLQTFPSQQFYTLNVPLRKINTVVINVGNSSGGVVGSGFNWPVRECPSMEIWNQLNLTQNIQSDIPQYYFYYNNQLGIYPRPASGYNPITIRGQVDVTNNTQVDLTETKILTVPYVLTLLATPSIGDKTATLSASQAVLPTGTYQMIFSSGENKLVTLTKNSTAVTWLSALSVANTTASVTIRTATGGEIITGTLNTTWVGYAGYVIQIAQPSGDGYYYTIDQVYDSTHLSILGAYQGVAVGASTSYTIGQTSILPPVGQMIPIYRAIQTYYTTVSKDESRAKSFESLANSAEEILRIDMGNKDTNPAINDDFDKTLINPNLALNLTQSSTNQ
jgi:hypothetical protein